MIGGSFAEGLRSLLDRDGLDITATLSVQAYNAAVPHDYAAPTFGRDDTLGILIGNTRALWPAFLASYANDPHVAGHPNPLDEYCRRVVMARLTTVLAELPTQPAYEVFFAPEAPPRRILLQRAAQAAGLAYLAPSQLCIHPAFGPWFSLRAFIALHAPWRADAAPHEPNEPALMPSCPAPCDCTGTCRPVLEELTSRSHTPGAVRASWRDYLRLRDACPVGRACRFTDEQIRYHYTHDRAILDAHRLPPRL